MIPVIALVGRPNVGKSTLFNRLTKSRDALVASMPGLTRDRQYGEGQFENKPYIVIDTGGLFGEDDDIATVMAGQTQQAVKEADIVLFIVDARVGLCAADEVLAQWLRRQQKIVNVIVNKIDGVDEHLVTAEFHALGLGDLTPISATHGRGVTALLYHVLTPFSKAQKDAAEASLPEALIEHCRPP